MSLEIEQRDNEGIAVLEMTGRITVGREATALREKVGDGFAITESHLELKAKVPGASEEAFEKAVQNAKTGCPVSKLYKTNITLSFKLEN